MDSEKLIALVRGYSFLYDPEDKKYSDNIKKDAAWREIGKMLNKPNKDCKKKWANLRDCYRRFLRKKRNTTNGQATRKIKKWKYEGEMAFLIPFFQERDTATTIESDSAINEEVEDEVHEEEQGEADNTIGETCTAAPSALRTNARTKPASSMVMDFLLNNTDINEDTDEISLFFKSVAAGVKKLTPYNQIIARRRMFTILSQLQMEELAIENHNQYSSSAPSTSQSMVNANVTENNQ